MSPERKAGDAWTLYSPWRGLIAVTTCNREVYLRRCLPSLAQVTVHDPRLSLVVSLDGDDAATQRLCEAWDIPLLTSDAREGVGIAKNRVLEQFPNFDYYFFLEDDVEVLDQSIFVAHIAIAHALDMHHMSLFEPRLAKEPVRTSRLLGADVLHCGYGSADFNFFTRLGLDTVGGWHPEFARHRRWGHTEHSYRFPRAGLAPAPFNVAVSLASAAAWHSPPSVTRHTDVIFDAYQVAEPERKLLDLELHFVAPETIGPYRYNGVPLSPLVKLCSAFNNGGLYPLLNRSERRLAYADRLVWKMRNDSRPTHRLVAGWAAGLLSPNNPEWRHEVKAQLGR